MLYCLVSWFYGIRTACHRCKTAFSRVLVDQKTEKINSRMSSFTYNDPIKVRYVSGNVIYNFDREKTGMQTVNTYYRQKKF